ncbi:YmaF family protein [Sporotomaculum syntrophicum]|uniref:YmaF family protein n=2 Tax=Sporotomaculum syntrophicum TaxID=182264 RepID=A0A9D2WPN8_9FIRM|nr:YmaF family protein [Sporotomaculum syntrophicum]
MGYGMFNYPKRRTHVHNYRNKTSFAVGHLHGMEGTTSPTIRSGRSHVHCLSGTTTFNDGHSHKYNSLTGPAIPVSPGTHVHRYNGVTASSGRVPHTHRYSGVTTPAQDDE